MIYNILMISNLPYRFRESSFRRFEPHINDIVNCFPGPITIDPTPLSQVTFSCRLRDAMKSLSLNRWQTEISMERFDRIYRDIVVSEGQGVVRVGSSDTIRNNKPLIPCGKVTETSGTKFVELIYPDLGLFVAACLMVDRKILNEVRAIGVEDEWLEKYAASSDLHWKREDRVVVINKG